MSKRMLYSWRSLCEYAAQAIATSPEYRAGLSRSKRRHTNLFLGEVLEPRQFLSASVTNLPLTTASGKPTTPAASYGPLLASASIALNNQSQNYATLVDTTVTMTGKSELYITGSSSPITGSFINLNSADSWVFFTNVKPSVVNSTYLSQISVNGAAAVQGSNVRVAQYGLGTVVIPHAPTYQPLQTFSGPNFTGSSQQFSQYTYYNTDATLGTMKGNISSFKLKRGYMATIATRPNGSGISKVYVAQDYDLDIALLPSELDNGAQFVRVIPWRWVSKKGSGDIAPEILDASWHYNWNNSLDSTLDWEYVPIKQQPYWPGLPTNKPNVTHLLGFNEPNNPVEDAYEGLGNGSVDAAIAFWPDLLTTGLRVGAPAVTDGGKAWLYEFMDKAIAANLRVDYIAIHNYQAGNSATSLYNWLKDVYDRYHLPIWLTEFNNGANWTTAADPTLEQNATAIGSFIDMMDNTPWIERYAIYSAVEAVRQMVDANGALTPAGVVYKNNASPIGYVQEPSPSTNTQSRGITQLPLDGNTIDTSGYGHTGQLVGGPNYVAGQRGQAIVLDGTSNYIQLPKETANGDSFTFSSWINWDGGANFQRIFDFGTSSTSYMYLTPSNGSKLRFAIKNGGTEQFVETNPIAVGQWTHVAVTLGAGSAKLYVNGALAATSAVTIKPGDFDPTNNYLGKSQFTTDPLLKGRLDEVQISDTVLTPSQIAGLMTDTAPQFASAAFTRGPAVRGIPFVGTITGTATDADAGDTVTYSKANGPAWLIVAADGTLGGTPAFGDMAPQEFVVAAMDAKGVVTYAVMTIPLVEFYWRGDVSGVWSANTSGNTNWASDLAGTTDAGTLPGASSDVYFGSTIAGNLSSTSLGSNISVRSLRFGKESAVTIGGANSLTIGSYGIDIMPAAGTVTINTSGQVVLGANQFWNTDNDLTVSSVISGAFGLTKTGVDPLNLLGNNLYTGPTTIAAGTLNLGNGGTSGSILGNIINNGILTVNRSNDVTLDGVISGSGYLNKLAAGRLTLTNYNTYSGGTTIGNYTGAGVLRASATGAMGTGAVTIGPGGNATTARLELANNITLTNAISLPQRTNTSVSIQNISGTSTLAGAISLTSGGSAAIFQSDAGLLRLGAMSSATGARTPTLTGNGNGQVNGIIADGAGTVALVKSGVGTWTLNGANTYTVGTTINAGVLAIGAAERIGNTTPLTLAGGTLATGGFNETVGAISLSANSTINLGSGASTLKSSALGTLTAGTTLTITNWTQGADHFFIGTTAALTAAQLAQINFNGTAAQQLSTGEIIPVTSAAPTVQTAAAASPSVVTGTSTTLSVLGADNGTEAKLTYTWAVTSKPAGAIDPIFSANGTNAAKSSVATFSKTGAYTFTVTILDGSGLTVTSSINVTVNATLTGIAAGSNAVASGAAVSVTGVDQFGATMTLGGTATWSTNAGLITQAGVFTAPVSGATSANITAQVGATVHTTTLSIVAGRGWYKADVSGATLVDSSGSSNNGTLTGPYSYVAGKAGNALSLTGGAADLPDGIVSGLNDFTIGTWVYFTSNPSWARVFDFGTGATDYMFLTNNPGGTAGLRFAIANDGVEQVINAPAISLNTWTHVAVSMVGDVGTIYVNGVAVGTNANMTLRPANLGATTNNYLGDSQFASDAAFQGRLDDFRVLGTGLNAAGIVGLRDVWRAPSIATAASASTVSGMTTNLSVLGASAAGEAGLIYTWSLTGTPPALVNFSSNGSNAAKNTTATFTQPGSYNFLVTITDASGAISTSSVIVEVTSSAIVLNGTSGPDVYRVVANGASDEIYLNNVLTQTVSRSSITSLTFNGVDGDDKLIIDYANGDPTPTGGIAFDGGIGNDTIEIRGASVSDSFAINSAGTITHGSAAATYAGTEAVILTLGNYSVNADLGAVNLAVSAATATLTQSQNLTSLLVNSGAAVTSASTNPAAPAMVIGGVTIDNATLTIAANGNLAGVSQFGSLYLNGNARLDLHDNDLVLDYGSSASAFPDVVNQIKSGLTGLGGNGFGIGSTAIDNQSVPGAMLGVMDNTAGIVTQISGYTLPHPTTSVLLQYTWLGDANLDGAVDGTDYALVDSGFGGGGTTWDQGDFNYDGQIDGTDYALIDSGFGSQTN